MRGAVCASTRPCLLHWGPGSRWQKPRPEGSCLVPHVAVEGGSLGHSGSLWVEGWLCLKGCALWSPSVPPPPAAPACFSLGICLPVTSRPSLLPLGPLRLFLPSCSPPPSLLPLEVHGESPIVNPRLLCDPQGNKNPSCWLSWRYFSSSALC